MPKKMILVQALKQSTGKIMLKTQLALEQLWF